MNEKDKNWRKNKDNKSKVSISKKNYYAKNTDLLKEKAKKVREKCKETTKVYQKQYRIENKDKAKVKQKIYRLKNREKLNKKLLDKLKNDPLLKLSFSIRRSISGSLKKQNHRKTSKSVDILGCSFKYFQDYIYSKFEPWMNWENYGKYNGKLNYGWDLDHIIPVSSAKNKEEIYKLNHYTNFQPLCSFTNRHIKRDK
jgi:hypothetical protein